MVMVFCDKKSAKCVIFSQNHPIMIGQKSQKIQHFGSNSKKNSKIKYYGALQKSKSNPKSPTIQNHPTMMGQKSLKIQHFGSNSQKNSKKQRL